MANSSTPEDQVTSHQSELTSFGGSFHLLFLSFGVMTIDGPFPFKEAFDSLKRHFSI